MLKYYGPRFRRKTAIFHQDGLCIFSLLLHNKVITRKMAHKIHARKLKNAINPRLISKNESFHDKLAQGFLPSRSLVWQSWTAPAQLLFCRSPSTPHCHVCWRFFSTTEHLVCETSPDHRTLWILIRWFVDWAARHASHGTTITPFVTTAPQAEPIHWSAPIARPPAMLDYPQQNKRLCSCKKWTGLGSHGGGSFLRRTKCTILSLALAPSSEVSLLSASRQQLFQAWSCGSAPTIPACYSAYFCNVAS